MRNLKIGLLIAFLVVIIDQFTKILVARHFSYGETLTLFPGFDLTLRHNTGAAFNLFAEGSGWQRWFLIAIAVVISGAILVWLSKLKEYEKLEAWGLSLILGGALGNLIDRMIHAYVIDFILWYYKEWAWPAFNIADTAICIGVCLFLITLFYEDRKKKVET